MKKGHIMNTNNAARVCNRWMDLPVCIREFLSHPTSQLNSPDKGCIECSHPLNQEGDKMYPIAPDDLGYAVFTINDSNEHVRELAKKTIAGLSVKGEIARYDLPDGTLCYASFND